MALWFLMYPILEKKMFHASLSGLTPDKLADVIQDSPTGFFIDRDVVYYLGKPIELSSGKTLLAREDEPEGSHGALIF